jgi:hypothetical protein
VSYFVKLRKMLESLIFVYMNGCVGPIPLLVNGLNLLYIEVDLALKLANLCSGLLLIIGFVDAISYKYIIRQILSWLN